MGICAFCGRDRTLTREHVFPDWLLTEFPPVDGAARSIRILAHVGKGGRVSGEERDEGPVSAPSRVAVVCTSEHAGDDGCNSGWMSQLEEDAQPIITDLGSGRSRMLSTDDQRLLAFWASKTTMMIEYTDHTTRATSPEQRRFLYQNRATRTAPDDTIVLIGKIERPPDPPLAYFHRGATFVPRTRTRSVDIPPANVQQTSMILGHLVLVVFGSSIGPMQIPEADLVPLGLRRILPEASSFRWPHGHVLTPEDVIVVAELLPILAGSPEGVVGAGGLPRRARDA